MAPFEGVVRDGRLIGRGAADMKDELAARAVALAALARSGAGPAGDVVLVAEADEERNRADVGMSWLVRERPDLRCDYALNEGGGSLLELADGRRVVTVSVGEKLVTARFGSASSAAPATPRCPSAADNPLRHSPLRSSGCSPRRAAERRVAAVERALAMLGRRRSRRRGGDRLGRRAASVAGRPAAGDDPDDGDARPGRRASSPPT